MGDQQDKVALILFVLLCIASVLSERLCGADAEHCPLDWSHLYGKESIRHLGHCPTAHGPGNGLGDPLLSVSSLFLCLAAVYLTPTTITPVASFFIGVGSFLFHAADTKTSATLDYVGMCGLGAALMADLAFVRPGWAWLFWLCFTGAAVGVRLGFLDAARPFLYVTQGFFTFYVVLLLAHYRRWEMVPAAALILGGVITLVVANNDPNLWSCIDTQLAEPHVYGHVAVGAGTVLYSRSLYAAGRAGNLYKLLPEEGV